MSVAKLLEECRSLGVLLSPTGEGKLRYEAPFRELPRDLRERLVRHRDELLVAIELIEERSAIIEFDGGLSRAEAERLARCSTIEPRARELFCCWCRSESLLDDRSGLRCGYCGLLAWRCREVGERWWWVRADVT